MLRLFQGPPDISLHRAPKKLDTALCLGHHMEGGTTEVRLLIIYSTQFQSFEAL